MSEKTLKEIEDELDDLSLHILELMNDTISCKMNIEKAVRSGCLDLAKTRYILGNTTSVSTLKVPTENVSATATVVSEKSDQGKLTYELKSEKCTTPDDGETKTLDPLKWFGILVPTNLRQGQTWFKRALDLSVQCANISADLNTSMDKYKQLMEEKRLLKDVETSSS